MRHIITLVLALLVCTAAQAQKRTGKYVEVVYFHGTQRCLTCRAIEKLSKEVVYADFAKEVKQGKVRFREVDFSTPAGEKVADRYKVTWSSLYVNGWNNGKEKRNDMTKMGFKNARKNAAVFKSELKKKILQMLK